MKTTPASVPFLLVNGEGAVGVPAAVRVLQEGGSALDALEAGVRVVEADPSVRSVGRGGSPNLLGEMECDACIMEGAGLLAGAVGGLRGFLHPITVARKVMEALPHGFLIGEGAARLAREMGCEAAEMLTPEAARAHQDWLRKHVRPGDAAAWPEAPLASYAHESTRHLFTTGTTVYLARDAAGDMAAAASTSGWPRKYPGRIGDSAVIGAGAYADNAGGAGGCTHTGEMTIRAGTSHSVVREMRRGASAEEAVKAAAADLSRLRGGYLGPVMIHAVAASGEPFVGVTQNLGPDCRYFYWKFGMAGAERRAVALL